MSNAESSKGSWTRITRRNGNLVAVHERTMYMHKVAMLGAASVKECLLGKMTSSDPSFIAKGVFGRPVVTRANSHWLSPPVYLGESELNVPGFNHEFSRLSVYGTLETVNKLWPRRRTSLTFFEEGFGIERLLGDDPTDPSKFAEPAISSIYIDRRYTCQDYRVKPNTPAAAKIADYNVRLGDIETFMDELQILAEAAGLSRVSYDVLKMMEHDPIDSQLPRVAGLANEQGPLARLVS